MDKTLVIVESPAKAKTINKFLGPNFKVLSSFGHIRDLPKKELGVDIENNFEPKYINDRTKTKLIKELKTESKKAKDKVLFATDEDREGEAISWHLAHILGIKPKDALRIVFHEITKEAILKAVNNPRSLDMNLVDAQQARRVLDRLVGYQLSPFLWRKVAKGLSAGRVQSVAVRLVVEREREIKDFKPQEYWSIEGLFNTGKKEEENFPASLYSIEGKKINKFDIVSNKDADNIVEILKNNSYTIKNIEQKQTTQNPPAPFTTSTLQQAANARLGYSAKQIMRLAQQLYEGVELGSEGSVGLITYMRTDSVNLSEKFLNDAKEVIIENYGVNYALDNPRIFKSKSKNAQEAHEAIRPTEAMRTPESVKVFLTPQQHKLYNLIWSRAVASQMQSAKIDKISVDIEDKSEKYLFSANGQTIAFAGFLKIYPQKQAENLLPPLKSGEKINCIKIEGYQHFTEPPARYSDATLVKSLEEYGIGRPSTYAPTISTIETRGYVARDEHKRLFPQDIAYLVNDILVEHFPHIVDYKFTADMEEQLDEVSRGEKEWQPVIANFYIPFKENLNKKDKELSKKELTEQKSDEICDLCSSPMVIKTGRFGKFFACSNYPECKNTKRMTGDKIAEINPQKEEQIKLLSEKYAGEVCEKCGAPMAIKIGRFGPFLGCSNYPKCKTIKNIGEQNNSTGVKCPVCKEGEIVMKRSRRGPFYACNAYPKCKTILNGKPTEEKCPECSWPIIEYGKEAKTKCSNKECSTNN